jgi:hypothetical protein
MSTDAMVRIQTERREIGTRSVKTVGRVRGGRRRGNAVVGFGFASTGSTRRSTVDTVVSLPGNDAGRPRS